jgi:16S rRNA (adenine1518-N6/adenine1519-N6)-dimethyltransferase
LQRLAASAGTSEYSRLTVVTQRVANIIPHFLIDSKSFVPAPQVCAKLITLQPRAIPLGESVDFTTFEKVCGKLFPLRRKTLENAAR